MFQPAKLAFLAANKNKIWSTNFLYESYATMRMTNQTKKITRKMKGASTTEFVQFRKLFSIWGWKVKELRWLRIIVEFYSLESPEVRCPNWQHFKCRLQTILQAEIYLKVWILKLYLKYFSKSFQSESSGLKFFLLYITLLQHLQKQCDELREIND